MSFNLVMSFEWFFIGFFILINLGYLGLNLVSLIVVRNYSQWRDIHTLPQFSSKMDVPITLMAAAFNEENTISSSLKSLLQINYPNYEVIVINDGSTDNTLKLLIEKFELFEIPEYHEGPLYTQHIRKVFRSKSYPNLRVIDKINGGKADSLNAGLNYCRTPLFCSIDADSVLDRNSLQRVILPFLQDKTTIASGGTIRILNGCQIKEGLVQKVGLPKDFLSLAQIVEYLRAFLFGRMGWSALNSLMIISGAFGAFRKDVVLEVGGYKTNTIGEDMELIMRMHRYMVTQRRPYKIRFVPDPICWTEAPTDLKTLKNQRVRWQRGLSESLVCNRALLFHPRGGVLSWFAFPFTVVFEWLEPIIQVVGYVFTIWAFSVGMISAKIFFSFFIIVIGFGVLLSTSSLLLEEISFQIYAKTRQSLVLFMMSILENFGYRQLNSYWRLLGVLHWLFGKKRVWGVMKRRVS